MSTSVSVELVIPTGVGCVIPLTLTADHCASSYGLGVLIDPDGDVLGGTNFRAGRDCDGWLILTDDAPAVCRALGVPVGEPGIIAR